MKIISFVVILALVATILPVLSVREAKAMAYTNILSDPLHTSDEDFFGVWNGSEWTTEPKLNYSGVSGLSEVESAVKSANYDLAKEKLLKFAKNKPSVLNPGHRNTAYAKLLVNGFTWGPYYNFYQGSFKATKEQTYYSTNTYPENLQKSAYNSFRLVAVENQDSYFVTYSKDHQFDGLEAMLELYVNGKRREYYAVADSQISAGNSKSKTIPDNGELCASTNGAFLGDGTSHILLKFDLSDISESDKINSSKLTVFGQLVSDTETSQNIFVMREPDSSWNESSVTWSSILGMYYNFNGLSEGITWERPGGDDIEYLYQLCRFNPWPALCYEYVATGDELYAQTAISIMMDFINDKGNVGVKGQFPRTLDTSERFLKWIETFPALSKSSHMTPDRITAIYKHIYDMGHSFMVNRSSEANWVQNEMTRLYNYSGTMSELTESTLWKETAQNELSSLYIKNNFPDGSYIEGCSSYNIGAMKQFIQFKESMPNGDIGKENDEMMLKAAYYNRLMFTPDGRGIQWGDSGLGDPSYSEMFPQIYKWYGDEEFLYIDSFGAKGKKPEWTSKVFYDNRTATMRSSWDRDALFMFTNVRGGGWHSNGDDNHVFVSAYGRPLLTDTGIMSYTGGSDEKNYAVATIGHNTVEIDGKSQVNCHFNPSDYDYPGTIHDWESDKNYDFISQTALTNRVKTTLSGTKTIEHKRSILFIKPFGFIVSDFMTPYNSYTNHEYKQLWHMLPEAKLSASDGVIKSNFFEGANVLVASADSDAQTLTGDGWFDYSYNQISKIKHGYFYKKACGNTTFDTVIMPSENDANATLDAQRISLNVATTTATSLKYTIISDGKTNIGYYYMSYENTPSVRTFGEFETDGKIAFVNTDENGKINMVILKDGTYVSQNGQKLVCGNKKIDSVSVTVSGGKVHPVTLSDAEIQINIPGSDEPDNNPVNYKKSFENYNIEKSTPLRALAHRDEDYSDGKLNTTGYEIQTTDGGTLSESGSYLHLTRTSDSGRIANCHYIDGAYGVTGDTFASLKIKKNKASAECIIRFLPYNTVYLKWGSDSKLYGMYRNTDAEGECNEWKYICDIKELEKEFYIHLNTDTKTYSLWLDGKIVLSDAYTKTPDCTKFDYAGVFCDSGAVGDVVSIDYIKGGTSNPRFIPLNFELELIGNELNAKFNCKGIDDSEADSIRCCIALYDSKNNLAFVKYDTVSNAVTHSLLAGYGSVNIYDDISSVRSEISSFKAFVWNENNLIPLCSEIFDEIN